MSSPLVSVVVPAYRDPERLRACLDALAEQRYPAADFEVVVADNGSEPPLEAQVGPRSGVRFVRETAPGSYAARNAGVRASRGDILAFTDSDCLPEPGWIAAGVAALGALPDGGLVGGRVEVYLSDPAHPSPTELYEAVLAFRQERNVRVGHFAVTANAFTTRDTFTRVGPFDASMVSGGDREWGRRVHAAGLPAIYAHDAVVLHPARRSFAEIARKMARVARGHHALAARDGGGRRFAELGRALAPPVASLVEIWSSDRLRGPGQRVRASAVAVAAKYRWAAARLHLLTTGDDAAAEGRPR